MENKELFVEALKVAFLAGDNDRYREHIWAVEYRVEGGLEYLCDYSRERQIRVNVTGASCAAIAQAFIEHFL